MTTQTSKNEVSKYILNKTKYILFIQNDDYSTLVKLEPYKCSTSAFPISKLEKVSQLKKLLITNEVELSDEYLIVEDVLGKDYGQKAKIGETYVLKGAHNLEVKILRFDPSSKIYTVKNLISNAKMKIKDEDIDFSAIPMDKQVDKVEIVRNEQEEVLLEKSAQDVLNNSQEVDISEDDIEFTRVSDQEIQEDDNEVIVKSASEPFAKEVSMTKIRQDTAKVVQSALKSAVEEVVYKKPQEKRQDLTDFPEIYKQWYIDFLNKDERKKKMTIAVCNDKEKLELLIKYGDENIKTLAETRLQKIISK